MTVRKAIDDLNFLIHNKQDVKAGLFDSEKPWNRGEPPITSFVNSITLLLQRDIDSLHLIKKQLLPEQHGTKIVCKHPKEMHDKCGGQLYCMNCNQDL